MAGQANPSSQDSRREPSRRRIFQQLPLTLPGRELPPSIPLILPSNLEYDPVTNSIKKLADKSSASPQLCLSDDAMILLQTIKKPVAVLAISGPFRSGKSYFLSRMLDSSDTFKVGHKMHGCTRGIWMATTALECKEFVFLLLDTEGIDATGVNISDATTARNNLVLSTLASSYLIYNSKDVPRQSDLDKMSCFAQLSSCIQTEAESDDLPDHHKHFPDLLWLLRDVNLEITDEDDQPLTPTEYIKSQVLCRSKDPGMCSPNDEVVKAIRTLFPSLECKIIPHPSRNPAKDPSMLSPEFNEALDEVIQYILGNVSAKKGYLKGDTVDGPTLAALLGQYVSALNTGPQLVLESTWLGAIRPRLEDLAQKALTDYKSKMTDLEKLLPLEEGDEETALQSEVVAHDVDENVGIMAGGELEGEGDTVAGGVPEGEGGTGAGELAVNANDIAPQTLMGIHQMILGAKLAILQHEMDSIIPVSSAATEAVKSSILSDLIKQIAEYEYDQEGLLKVKGGVLYQFIVKNYQKSTEHSEEVFTQVYRPLMENFNQPFDDKVNEYMTRAIGPAKQAVFEKRKREFCDFTAQLVPGPPQNLKAVGRGSKCIKIRWEPPTLHPVLTHHYGIEMRKTNDSGSMWSEVKKTKRMSALVTELNSDTKYSFRVRGVTVRSILVGNPSEEVHTETKFSQAARTATAVAAGVGAGVAVPAVSLGMGVKYVYDGIKAPDEKIGIGPFQVNQKVLGAAGIVEAPLSVLLYPVFAPMMGTMAGSEVYKDLNREGDLSDPGPSDEDSDHEELDSDHEELQVYKL